MFDTHNHYHVDLARYEGRLSEIEYNIALILTNQEKIMANQVDAKAALDNILAGVADADSEMDGIERVLINLTSQVKALKDAATGADIPAALMAQISNIDAALTTHKQRILDDIAANTDSAPDA